MTKRNIRQPRVALQIEKNRAHGRSLLEGISDYALEHTNWRLELVDPEQLSDVSSVRKYDGLIVRVMDDATADVLVKSRRPVVDTYGRVDDNPLASIRLDDVRISETAFACLAERHYRSFAYCGFPGVRFSDARGAAFRTCAEKAGAAVSLYSGKRPVTDKFFRNEKTDVPDAAALAAWLETLPKPVALFCCNDLRAVQAMKICADLGLNVPGDVAVLGVDNDVLLCTFANPPLSSILTDPFALGRQAAKMLDEQMRSRGKNARRTAARGGASGRVLGQGHRREPQLAVHARPRVRKGHGRARLGQDRVHVLAPDVPGRHYGPGLCGGLHPRRDHSGRRRLARALILKFAVKPIGRHTPNRIS